MNIHDPTSDTRLDAHVRAVHADSLGHLSARVQAQLAQRRRAALQPSRPPASRSLWPWATAATAACVLTLALQLRPAPEAASPGGTRSAVAHVQAVVDPRGFDPVAALDEDPEFYLWLASIEGQAYAVE